MSRPFFLTIFTFVLLLVVFAAGGFYIQSAFAETIANENLIRVARVNGFMLLNDQLNEETAVRGYASTHEHSFLEPWYLARGRFDTELKRLNDALDGLNISDAKVPVADAIALNAQWSKDVAEPLIDNAANTQDIQHNGKSIVDQFRAKITQMDNRVLEKRLEVLAKAQRSTDAIAIFTVLAGLAVVVAGSLIGRQQYRLTEKLEIEERSRAEAQAAYLAEKRISDTLQNAFMLKPLPTLSGMRLTAKYSPATDEARVGGDWYDGIELGNGQLLLTVGDAAGHGLDAVVAMNRARQSLISAALHSQDPAEILARVSEDLLSENQRMVTAICGYIDGRNYSFTYAAAGHPPPILLEPGRAPRTLAFGGLPMGVIEGASYQTYKVQTMPGAMLVFYTDGALEHAKDVLSGEKLLLEAVADANRDGQGAEAIHDAIFKNSHVGDDVAIVTLSFGPPFEAKSTHIGSHETAHQGPGIVIPLPVPPASPAEGSIRFRSFRIAS